MHGPFLRLDVCQGAFHGKDFRQTKCSSAEFSNARRVTAVGIYFFSRPIMKRHVLIFGLVGGLLIATLQYTEYRFVVIEHSFEIYGALVAILFSAFGIWLGLRITRRRETVREAPRLRRSA